MISIKRVFSIFLILDILLIALSIYLGGFWLINTQAGFIASMVVIICSFYGYKKIVEKKLAEFDDKAYDDSDLIDKKLDPHRLWEDEDGEKEQEEEKPKSKIESIKTSMKNTKEYSLGLFSPYRLFGYAVLIGICFFLINQNIFHPLAFFIGLSSTLIVILIYTLFNIKN